MTSVVTGSLDASFEHETFRGAAQVLDEAGCLPDAPNHRCKTALDMAIQQPEVDASLVQYLLECHSEVKFQHLLILEGFR